MWPLCLQSSFPGRCKNCLRAYRRQRGERAAQQRQALAAVNQVPSEWVEEQLAANDGACPICERKIRLGFGSLRLDEAIVDRRGVVCAACATALGALDFDAVRARRAVAYLERPVRS